MPHTWARRILALAAAGAVGFGYVQVAAVPATPTPPRPSLSSMVDHVQADLAWFRTAVPRDAGWWRNVYAASSGNLRELESLLTEPRTP